MSNEHKDSLNSDVQNSLTKTTQVTCFAVTIMIDYISLGELKGGKD